MLVVPSAPAIVVAHPIVSRGRSEVLLVVVS